MGFIAVQDQPPLSVGHAAPECSYCFALVGESGYGLNEARQFEDFLHVPGGIQYLQTAALSFERDERADQRADARAIDLGDAFEIHHNLGRAGLGEFAQFRTQRIVAHADDDAARQIKNRDVTGLSRCYLQAHDRLPGRARDRAKWPHYNLFAGSRSNF